MPKGRGTQRTATCRACGSDFTTDKFGKASWFCGTLECNAARGIPKARRELADRQRRVTEREEAKRSADEKRRETIERKMRERGLEIFAEVFDSPDQMMMVQDILEVAELAATVEPSNDELKKALTALSRAEGRHGHHRAAQRLAALFLRLSDRWRPRAEGREPAVSEVDAAEAA